MKKFYLLTVAVFLLVACAPAVSPSLAGEWTLVSYGSASNPTPADPSIDTSILFDAEKISGNVGCNQFNGSYTLNGSDITFDQFISTKMACIGNASVQESAILSVFVGAVTYSLNGDTLTITSADGASMIVLAKK